MSALLSQTPRTTSAKAATTVHGPSPLDLTDERLMEMIQEQNPKGVEHLYDRYAPLVKAMIMRVLHNDAESDDMLQEIFVEIWNRAASYDSSKGKPLGWIITLSRRRAIDRLRKREAYCRMEDRLLEATKHVPEEVSGQLEDDVAHGEMRQHINRVLGSLPPAQQEVIHLAYYKGLSQREIAAETGIPLGTIKTRLELAIKKLSVALSGYEDLL